MLAPLHTRGPHAAQTSVHWEQKIVVGSDPLPKGCQNDLEGQSPMNFHPSRNRGFTHQGIGISPIKEPWKVRFPPVESGRMGFA